jgi:Uma2 family endonuclease
LPFNSDLRLKVEATGLLTYPDLSVICGPARFVDDERDTVTNPVLLAEVLSESTESYDRGAKFRNYVRIPSLREYLLVSQQEPRIEQFIRQEPGPWVWREAAGLEATVDVPSLGIQIALAEVFAKVSFQPGSLRRR